MGIKSIRKSVNTGLFLVFGRHLFEHFGGNCQRRSNIFDEFSLMLYFLILFLYYGVSRITRSRSKNSKLSVK